jgi:hypothetical protein
MYEEYFGFTKTPFMRDIEVKKLYLYEDFQELKSRLKYAIDNRLFAAVTGEVGIGKSTAIRAVVDDIRELTDSIVEKPTYDSKNRSKRKLTDEIIEKIEFYLKENEYKRSIGQSKQQKKKTDIYEALIAEGYDISYPTVVNTVNNLLSKGAEAYIKAEYDPGDVCEFDWGEVKLYIDNEYKVLQLSTFTSAKGNFRTCPAVCTVFPSKHMFSTTDFMASVSAPGYTRTTKYTFLWIKGSFCRKAA